MKITIDLDRLNEILRAEAEGRLEIRESVSDINLKIQEIEVVLGFKLHDWQKKYILGISDERPSERACGSTTAWILRLLLEADAEPLHMYMPNVRHSVSDQAFGLAYDLSFRDEMQRIYDKLMMFPVSFPLRKVYFHPAVAAEFEEPYITLNFFTSED